MTTTDTPAKARRRLPKWARWTLAVLSVPVLIVVVAATRDALELASVPDIGDPFDLDAFIHNFPNDIPKNENAFYYYDLAWNALLPNRNRPFEGLAQGNDPPTHWRLADEALRARCEENRPALELWRKGTEQDKALHHRLEEVGTQTLLPITQELRHCFLTLALLEGSRLEDEGDMAGAWVWYRAALRSSRHSGTNGFLIERLVGISIYQKASERVIVWAADPRVDATLLRQARADLKTIDAMTPHDDNLLKLEYMITLQSTLDPKEFATIARQLRQQGAPGPPIYVLGRAVPRMDPREWTFEARLASGHEAERTRRVLRLFWANHLPQFAKAPHERPEPWSKEPLIFPFDETAPAAVANIKPEDLARWHQSLAVRPFPMNWAPNFLESMRKDASARERLLEEVEGQLRKREQGEDRPCSDEHSR